MIISEILKRCELFLGLNDVDIIKIADLPSCEAHKCKDQEVIFQGSEEATHLYIVADGRVNLFLKIPPGASQSQEDSLWGVIPQGGVFGWTALVPPHIRIGSALSNGPSNIISISGNELRILFEEDTKLGYEVTKSLVRVISSRVWNIEKLLATGKRSPFI